MDERTLFLTALEKTNPAERADWLAKACGDNAALRQRVEALLRTHDDAGSFLEHPPADCLAATAVSDPSTAKRPPTLEFLSPSAAPGCLGALDHYEVLQEVGRGGMGVVLKARDTKLERIVAIKVLAPELAANGMARKRFLREAKAAAAVAHPHVVAIHSIDENRPYLVMEYIEGQSLKDKIDRTGALELKEILRIGSQIAAGLAAAHKQGLIHRDIKPANILLENGVQRVKITDFGLARAVDDIALTRTGEVAGTPQFMSPEQAQGHVVDHRSDLFSLGSVLYTLCTGRTPFRGDSTIAVIRRVCDDTPRPIRETNPDVPEWLCHIIDRLLEKDPADRFQTAEEVSDLLALHLAHEQQPQVTPQPAPLPRRIPTNHAATLKALRGPARGLIVTACVNWITMIVLLLVGIAVLGQFPSHFALGAAEAILVPVLILGSSLILWGGLRMLNGESYGLCVFASVLAMLIGPGYFVGWPVGIWSLIVLTRPEVRDLFRRRKETAAPSRRVTETSEESAGRRTGGASWISRLAAGLLLLVFVVGAINVFHDLTALPAPSPVRALGLIAGGLMFLLLASRVAEAPLLQTGLDWLAGFALLFGGGELIRTVLPQAEALIRGNGTLVVQTDDPTVEVFIDGQSVPLAGRQTLELETFPGTHMVEFRRDSRQLSQHVLRIERGEMAVARWSNDQSRAIAGLPAATADGASTPTLPLSAARPENVR